MHLLYGIINLFIQLYVLGIIVRVVMDWTGLWTRTAFADFIFRMTEPFLAPMRRYTVMNDIDFGPAVALLILGLLRSFLRIILTG